jgi:uncharacterized membrane protein YraQ (UPF0718 family)
MYLTTFDIKIIIYFQAKNNFMLALIIYFMGLLRFYISPEKVRDYLQGGLFVCLCGYKFDNCDLKICQI